MKRIRQNKAVKEMTAKELKDTYMKAHKRILYAKKRIEHEEGKEFSAIPIKVTGTSAEFPYLPNRHTVEGEDPAEIKQSRETILKWQREIARMEEKKQEIEERIDNIEDLEVMQITWSYCIENKKIECIANEMNLHKNTISKKLKQIEL